MSSSEEEFIAPSASKKVRTMGRTSKQVVKEEPKAKLKPISIKDYFGQAALQLPKIPKLEKKDKIELSPVKDARAEKKRKSPEEELFDDDDDFESLVQGMDFNEEIKVAPSPVKKSKIDSSTVQKGTKIKHDHEPKQDKKRRSNEENEVKNTGKDRCSEESKKSKPEAAKSTDDRKKIKEDTKTKVKTDTPFEARIKSATVPPKDVPKPVVQSPKGAAKELPRNKPSTSGAASTCPELSKPSQSQLKVQEASAGESKLWVEKYKPTNSKTIIGQQGDSSNLRKLTTWITNWHKNNSGLKKGAPKPPPWNSGADNGFWAKAALLSGPPGVGKTTTAYLIAKELGYDVMELNASDTRSKKQLGVVVSDAVNSQSLSTVSTKRILLMDEVDGMAGNEDRGGVAELIQLIKHSKIPVVCMCNDRNHPKIRSLSNYCFDLRFQRPRVDQIKAAMMSICFKEKLKMSPEALCELISGCNQDIRQVLHTLSMIKAKDLVDGNLSQDEAKEEADKAKKTSIKIGPWDVCRKVFSSSEQKAMNLSDKSDLFFHDYSIGPLFVQENYLSAMPDEAKGDPKKAIVLASKAASSICDGDLVERLIRSQNSWSLLPVEAMFASVIPGEYMSGFLQGQIQFPNWLGKNSKHNKFDRIMQELQMHTRLSAGLSKRALNLDFLQNLRDSILRPMINDGANGVNKSVEAMSQYSLLRDDLDNLLEVTQWPDKPDPMRNIESKVKAAFTRTYNKEVVLPYATNLGTVNKRSMLSSTGDLLGEDLEGEEDDADEEEKGDDIQNDGMIKAKKPKASKAAPPAASAAASGSETAKPGRGGGGGRGRGGGGRGRGAKK